MRTLAMPLIVFIIWLFGIAILAQTSSVANKRYSSIENILETAQVIQDDLTRDAYGSNSFDIGYFEPTLPGVLAKFPKALTAGLFRPFIWEANNVLMLVSGVEGIIILIIFGFVLKITRISSFFRNTFKQPILMGLLVFTITFAFFVGLTTANFGAMVRYRIPVLPFFLIILFANFKDTTQENKSLE
ncbi:MAG: hypothetical protein PF517_03055 [Salinivirgaceae bacterium]|nr:hypothetical protein [Salinivirgaceae bacterium]